jgi:predicted nuclease of predicted toxin-antitoxin system
MQAGWDVIHVSEIGMSRADDVDILQRARAEARICVTLDADFHSLLAISSERGPSVIRIRKEGLDAPAVACCCDASGQASRTHSTVAQW